jgi:hypothetical protein
MAELEYSLENPLIRPPAHPAHVGHAKTAGGRAYDAALAMGEELMTRPLRGGGPDRVRTQHAKNRMTVWERIKVLTDREPTILWRNWTAPRS